MIDYKSLKFRLSKSLLVPHTLLLVLIFCSTHAFALSKIVSIDLVKEVSKVSEKDPFIFLSYNSTLNLRTGVNDAKKYESVLGPFKNKNTSSLRKIAIDKFPSWPFHNGDRIDFYNISTEKVETYTVNKFFEFALIPSPYFAENDDKTYFYDYFYLILSPEAKSSQFYREDSEQYNGIAVKSNSLKLKPGLFQQPKTEELKSLTPELENFRKYHLKFSSDSKVFFVHARSGLQEYLIVSGSSNKPTSYFLKTSNETYLHWLDFPFDDLDFGMFGNFIEGSEGTGILEYSGRLYLVIFYKDHIKAHLIWQARNQRK